MGQFSGKVVVITGGSSGIGEAAASLFAQEGAKVIVASRGAENGERVTEEIKAAGGEAQFIQTDVADEAQVEAMVLDVVSHYGGIDVVFNNAGSGPRGAWQEDEESWHHTIETVVSGTFYVCKRVVPIMEARGGGAIVNMSSIAAISGNLPDYHPVHGLALSHHASKGAIDSYTRALAVEVGGMNVRVNCVRPGWISTPLTNRNKERAETVTAPFFVGRQALKYNGTSKDVAHAVVFLASQRARFITGQILAIDGGYTLT
jgi:NAD(P)-dependent dehydrogenase (short-subunit alcohol dehydrogenase family)